MTDSNAMMLLFMLAEKKCLVVTSLVPFLGLRKGAFKNYVDKTR